MNIPDIVPGRSIRPNIPGLFVTQVGATRTIEEVGYDPVPEGTSLRLDADTSVVIGRQIGEDGVELVVG